MSSHSNHKDDADATDVEVEDTADGASSAIPLMAYPPDPDDASPTQDRSSATGLTPHLTLLPSIALVLSLQIGSGIFSAPSHVSLHVPSPGVGIAVWISAGCLVWTGAATFIELGLLIPKNGGAQEYLRAAWGEFTAFAFVWIYWIVARPAANGIVAGVGAEYVCGAFLAGRSGEGGANVSSWIVKPVALLGLWIVTVINCLGARVGPKVANGFVVLKIGVLLSIVGTGLVLLISSKAPATKADGFGWWTEQPVQGIESSGGNQSPLFWAGDFLIALFGALWCYGGWESVSPGFLSFLWIPNGAVIDRLCDWRDEKSNQGLAACPQHVYDDSHHRICAHELVIVRCAADANPAGEAGRRRGSSQVTSCLPDI